jgi:hypothetical protein
MSHVTIRFVVSALLAIGGASPVLAQTPVAASAQEVERVRGELDRLRQEFDLLRRTYDQRLLALEQRLMQIGGAPAAPTPPAQPPQADAAKAQDPTPPAPAVPTATSKIFNPDISVNGNVIAAAGRNPFATLSPLQLSEVEASFQAIVDPYARADFFLAVGAEGAEVEEGFITFTSLPAHLLLKAGKLRAQFGKINTLHTHALPTVDRSLVTTNLLGGDEGLADAGLSLSHLVNNPYVFLELTGEVFAGQSEVFQSVRRSRLAYGGRARAYRDLTDSANIDIGTSVAFGPATVDVPTPILTGSIESPAIQATGMHKRLVGFDATFRYRPLERAIYRRLNLRTELVWSRQDIPDGPAERAFGMYASAEYQFARRWYVGARADRSGRVLEASAIDRGASVFMTFWPTEFSQVRGQFRHIRFAEGVRGNEFLFQFNFSIGAHGAHVF